MSYSQEIEQAIRRIYKKIWREIFTPQVMESLASGDKFPAINAAGMLQSSEAYKRFAAKFSAELARAGLPEIRGQWRSYYRAAKSAGVVALPTTYTAYEMRALSAAEKKNLELIRTIPRAVVKSLEHKYTSALIEEAYKGNLPRGTFRRELEKQGAKNAKTIARTESAKVVSAAREQRSKSLGSTSYTWISSNDDRTRPSHRAMRGVICFWRPPEQKPLLDGMRGNPGELPNCRCTAGELFPDLNFVVDKLPAMVRIYDYRFDKVIQMPKQEAIQAIKRGNL